ncbi:hypothetical protein JG687_00009019 [Phytophthora cactorum]|uniref:Uncharacterized protein n=1 Tax=Phytophthora cactorum TaxID=29920 RepID=A0A8T1UB40_9STRA|nr:hypothetical protein PC123_g14953 [Phytophthora cactorum]KAG6959028.1 hypothetical protein JG687_00009019 [Phytophthora cactorum]
MTHASIRRQTHRRVLGQNVRVLLKHRTKRIRRILKDRPVNKDIESKYFASASQYVQEEVYKRLYEKNKAKLLQIIALSSGVSGLAVLRGILFEEHVHSVLSLGGVFRIRRLLDNNTGNDNDEGFSQQWDGKSDNDEEDDRLNVDAFTNGEENISMEDDMPEETYGLPKQSTVVFDNDDELAAADSDVYLRPAAKNYKSVDAIIKPDVLFQATGAHKHPCKQKCLQEVLKSLGDPSEPRLFFVLPPDRFNK